MIIDGPDAAEFSVVVSPAAPVAPGGSTTFTVRYTAASPGVKTAALHIASNVAGSKNPFDIVLNAVPGTLDTNFSSGVISVSSLAVQPDAKILVGGSNIRLARLLSTGSTEAGFAPNVNGAVNGIAVLADGKIVIGGAFSTVGGVTHSRMARLNADGTTDAGFTLGANSDVYCLAVQADGKILVGGAFTSFLAAGTRNFIARLNADGSLDAGFNPNANGSARSIAVQPDGMILVGGTFSTIGGVSRSRIARLNPDGSLDTGWNPGAGGEVRTISVRTDGKIIIGGLFTAVGGFFPANRIARFNPNGSVDFAFNPNANGTVLSTTLQTDGRILLAGDFTTIGGVPRNRIARLNADGSLDPAFDPNASGTVSNVVVQADGRVLLGGSFGTIGGMSRAGFARLSNDPATATLRNFGATAAQWLRDGASPELSPVTFDIKPAGASDWTLLGIGKRISGGWELTGLSLPADGEIRARGRSGGSLMESVAPIRTDAEHWRLYYFGSALNAGNGADLEDPDHDGLTNVMEFAYGLNPTKPDSGALPQFQFGSAEIAVSFATPYGVSGITYGAEWSSTLLPGSWIALPDTGSGGQHTFTLPMNGPQQFLRLKVTVP